MRLAIVIIFALTSLSALAQRVDIDINGRPYSCVPRDGGGPTPPPSGDPSLCANTAYAGPFTRDEALRLCSGARNEAPAKCAIKAYAGPFTKDEAINLCTRAYTEGPADCAVKAYAGPFTKDEALRLCSSPRASVSTADCAIRAYSGAYNREESINLCRNSKSESMLAELLSKEMSDQLMIEANEKAVREGVYKR